MYRFVFCYGLTYRRLEISSQLLHPCRSAVVVRVCREEQLYWVLVLVVAAAAAVVLERGRGVCWSCTPPTGGRPTVPNQPALRSSDPTPPPTASYLTPALFRNVFRFYLKRIQTAIQS